MDLLEKAKRRREKSGWGAKTQCRYRSELIIIWGVWTGLSRDCLEAPPWVMAALRWVNCPFAVAGRTTIGPWQWSEYDFGGFNWNQSTHDKYSSFMLHLQSLSTPASLSIHPESRDFLFVRCHAILASFSGAFSFTTNRSPLGRLCRTDAPSAHHGDSFKFAFDLFAN